jgi:tRNA (Thr-GGU) A37 N-methylase
MELQAIGRVVSPLVDPVTELGLSGVDPGDEVLAVDCSRLRVEDLEALHGTPVLDLKSVLGEAGER